MGQIGYRVADLLLRLGEPVSVITLEARTDWDRNLRARGAQVIYADARDEEVLREAGIDTARALIATIDQDAVNVELALDARERRPDLPVVIRLFDRELAHEIEARFGVRRALAMSAIAGPSIAAAAAGGQIIGSFDADGIHCLLAHIPIDEGSALAGCSAAQLASDLGLAAFAHEHPDEPGPIEAEAERALRSGDRITVAATASDWNRWVHGAAAPPGHDRRSWPGALLSALHPGLTLAFLGAIWTNAPLALKRLFLLLCLLVVLNVFVFQLALELSLVDAIYFVMTTVTTTGYGDISPAKAPDEVKLYTAGFLILGSAMIATLYSIITDFVVSARLQQALGGRRIPREHHTVVVGLGNVGYRTVEVLGHAAERVVAIERNPSSAFVESARTQVPVLIGDARVTDTLEAAGIRQADAVVAVTADDPTNLEVGLIAKRLNPSIRTVVRLSDADVARKAQAALGLDAAISTASSAAPAFVAAALHPHVAHALVQDGMLLVFVHQPIDEAWVGCLSEQLHAESGIRPMLRRRQGESGYHALGGEEALEAGDRIIAMTCVPLA
jgi:Trk K+ transport system NAD-binding subunit